MLFSVLLLLVSAKDRTHYFNGYFDGRSANVGVLGKLKQGENNLVLLGGNIETLPEEISVTDLGDVVARSYWVGKLKTASTVALKTGDLPSASLNLFSFGVDADDITEKTRQELFGGLKASALNIPFHPANPTSIVTSAFTGQLPSAHGVVGSTWTERGSEVEAFSSTRSHSAQVGVMELLKSNYPTMHLVAGGNDEILGRALTQGTSTSSRLAKQGYVSTDAKYTFTWDDLKSQLATDPFWVAMKTQVDALDLENPVVKSFLMEMEFLHRVTKNMSQKTDEVQVYSLASTSLENFPELTQEVMLIYLATVHQLYAKFNQVFPNGASQLAFIKTPQMHETSLHTHLESKLAELDYTPESARLKSFELNQVCDQDDVLCLIDSRSDQKPGDSQRTYQIGTWLGFFMAMTVLFFSCAFGGLNYTSDALLFTKWNRDM